MENLDQIREKVKVCIIESLGMDEVSPSDITNDMPFFSTDDTPGLIQDSLAILEVASRVSEEFGILPSDFGSDSFQNVNTLSETIHSLVYQEETAEVAVA